VNITIIQNVIWAFGFIVNVCLLLVLVGKQRWKQFCFFSAWIAFEVLLTITLFVVYRAGSVGLYSAIYWSTGILDFLLQLSVVIEMARIILRPTGTWVHDARKRFLLFGSLGTLIAAVATLLIRPSGPSAIEMWQIRANLFTSMMFCELFLAMMRAANRLGLQWGDHVMGLGRGLLAWAAVNVIVDSLNDLLGKYEWFNTLDELRGIVWIAAVIYWIVVFSRPQREKKPLSAEMQQYLVDLGDHVQYDLSRTKQSSSRLHR
jgi:hypothetical protein